MARMTVKLLLYIGEVISRSHCAVCCVVVTAGNAPSRLMRLLLLLPTVVVCTRHNVHSTKINPLNDGS